MHDRALECGHGGKTRTVPCGGEVRWRMHRLARSSSARAMMVGAMRVEGNQSIEAA